jgi:YHS domain-containing protein
MKLTQYLLVILLLSLISCAQKNTNNTYNVNLSNVLIDGYDIVSYQNNIVEKGEHLIRASYDGITIFFSSQKNKTEFKKHPTKYLPKYGGWRAYAIGDSGEKVIVNPNTYKIINGELYLFYNKNLQNTLKIWNKDEKNLKTKADQNWSKVK